jgi:hypothetical protein
MTSTSPFFDTHEVRFVELLRIERAGDRVLRELLLVVERVDREHGVVHPLNDVAQ